MARWISVALTQDAVRSRRKAVTGRLGWWRTKGGQRLLRPGDLLQVAPKVRGLQGSERELLAVMEVVDVRREPLEDIHRRPGDTAREGFPDRSPLEFVDFCSHMQCDPWTDVTRIEWRYTDHCHMNTATSTEQP